MKDSHEISPPDGVGSRCNRRRFSKPQCLISVVIVNTTPSALSTPFTPFTNHQKVVYHVLPKFGWCLKLNYVGNAFQSIITEIGLVRKYPGAIDKGLGQGQ